MSNVLGKIEVLVTLGRDISSVSMNGGGLPGNEASCHHKCLPLKLLENAESLKCFINDSDMIDIYFSKLGHAL